MEWCVSVILLYIVLFNAIEPKPIEEKVPYVRHIDEFFDGDYFRGVEL